MVFTRRLEINVYIVCENPIATPILLETIRFKRLRISKHGRVNAQRH
jgi:hypothetical protein